MGVREFFETSWRMTSRTGQVRIIGGKWKGRKVRFPALADLRPTPARLRETLFGWLGTRIVNARCLDLCAGSGALGFESLSRGAAHVDFVERDRRASAALRTSIAALDAPAALRCTDARKFLASAIRHAQRWDMIFLDPPFGSGLHDALLMAALTCLRDVDSRLCLELPAKRRPSAGIALCELRHADAGDTALWLLALPESD